MESETFEIDVKRMNDVCWKANFLNQEIFCSSEEELRYKLRQLIAEYVALKADKNVDEIDITLKRTWHVSAFYQTGSDEDTSYLKACIKQNLM